MFGRDKYWYRKKVGPLEIKPYCSKKKHIFHTVIILCWCTDFLRDTTKERKLTDKEWRCQEVEDVQQAVRLLNPEDKKWELIPSSPKLCQKSSITYTSLCSFSFTLQVPPSYFSLTIGALRELNKEGLDELKRPSDADLHSHKSQRPTALFKCKETKDIQGSIPWKKTAEKEAETFFFWKRTIPDKLFLQLPFSYHLSKHWSNTIWKWEKGVPWGLVSLSGIHLRDRFLIMILFCLEGYHRDVRSFIKKALLASLFPIIQTFLHHNGDNDKFTTVALLFIEWLM